MTHKRKLLFKSQNHGIPLPEIQYEKGGLWVVFHFLQGESSEKIIQLMKENPVISAQEIAENIKLSLRGVEKQISKLKKDGIIRRIGPAKGEHWEIINE